MSNKKKSRPATGKAASAPAKKAGSAAKAASAKTEPAGKNQSALWTVVGIFAIAAVAIVVVMGSGGSGGGAVQNAGATPPSADEQKYIGRLLPATYIEPVVAGPAAYSTAVEMTNVKAAVTGTEIAVSGKAVVDGKIVFFEVKNKGGETIPMLAYVKPSGKLFVGVSFCPPCKGTGQRIEADGTLTCLSCGTKRNLETMAGISGACKRYPLDELPAKVAGGKVVITKAALDSWTPQPLDRPTGA